MFSAVPLLILGATFAVTWAMAHGASEMLRLPFRILCHGMPSRSLLMSGVSMPICARCVGIYAGLLAGFAAFELLARMNERAARIAAIVAVIPLAIDGVTQAAGLRESFNMLRIATGLIAGFAFGFWVLTAIETAPRVDTPSP